jgi:hypothetical protein
MKKNYDPNLRAAVEEIRAVLIKRNIAGHVMLASPTHTEFAKLYDTPAWSCISFEKTADGYVLRIKAKVASCKSDFEKMESTVHMLCSFRDIITNEFNSIDAILSGLRKHMTILHLNKIGEDPESTPDDGT